MAQSLTSGRTTVTTGGTAVTLSSTNLEGLDWVVITAETDNTGIITVGGSDVVAALATRKGIPLNAGDTISLEVNNLSDVYLDTTVNGDGVTYLAGTR